MLDLNCDTLAPVEALQMQRSRRIFCLTVEDLAQTVVKPLLENRDSPRKRRMGDGFQGNCLRE